MIKIENITTIGDELAIAWSDGEESYLKLNTLRHACPCAHCQGEPDALGRVVKPTVILGPNALKLIRYEVIGGYALQITWGDGHSTGIYGFDYLRALK